MVNVSSLPDHGKAFFDLETQAGVMSLLASIRASEISSSHKNELRDLVFLYTNGGKDQTVRLALEQKIAAHKLTAVPQKVSSIQTPVSVPPAPVIGKYRTTPSFVVPAPTEIPIIRTVEPVPAPPPAAPVPENLPVAPVMVPVQSAAVPPPVPTPTPTPVAAPAVDGDQQQNLQRIREIKALVNEKVGNPVNLVDINNEVGREYMGALLDAMKKLNSGSSAVAAMQRLEAAFMAVEQTLKEHEQHPAAAAFVAQKSASVQEPLPSAYVAPEPVHIEAEPTVEPEIEETPASFTSITPRTGRIPIQEASYSAPQVEPSHGSGFAPAPVSEAPSAWEAPTPVAVPPPPAPAFTPLADAKERPRNISELPTAESIKTSSVEGDPLFTKDVDDGLQLLLMEWSIFKKSGLFGTGPKGREHPLFKKMAPLHIPLLLAGRFEGATQEVKQSVTDYMNGWRYEQGLIYQQGETFEHYLRRVIRHILDLQKAK